MLVSTRSNGRFDGLARRTESRVFVGYLASTQTITPPLFNHLLQSPSFDHLLNAAELFSHGQNPYCFVRP